MTVRGTDSADGVTIVDLAFGAEPQSTDAYLVGPEGAGPCPGIVFFHWVEYGSPTSNRTEFLDEARALAGQGVVSLLVDGRFPWKERPTSIEHDVAAVERDMAMLRSGLDLLAAQPGVNAEHIALVGHDFGAMYGARIFADEPSLEGMVMMAPTARWGDWFLRYWEISDAEDAYLAAMAPLDPVTSLARVGKRPMLLQFASGDQYVPESVAAEISAAAGPSAEIRTYDTGHELNEAARADRAEWLGRLLGFAAPR
jgi:predicted esterase